jgi:hypothetical protein
MGIAFARHMGWTDSFYGILGANCKKKEHNNFISNLAFQFFIIFIILLFYFYFCIPVTEIKTKYICIM